MSVKRYALIDADGVVCNIILWDANSEPGWTPPEGFTVRPDDGSPIEGKE